MLVSCKVGCVKNNGTTDASLDISSDNVICNVCGDTLDHISKFSKISMKNNGDVIKSPQRAFMFQCESCDKYVESEVLNHRVVGKSCKSKKSCMINVSKPMIVAMEVCSDNEKSDLQE